MKKKWYLLLVMFFLSACHAHDKAYYLSHPQALQKAIEQCADSDSDESGLSCHALRSIAQKMNALAFELQSNQQAYGQSIMALQTQNPRTKAIDDELEMRLAVLHWLASPGSRK